MADRHTRSCDRCGEREATFHIQEIIGGEKKSLHLCNDCAAQRDVGQDLLSEFSLAKYLYSLGEIEGAPAEEGAPPPPQGECSECHLTGAEFQETGRLGCEHCYEEFMPVLAEALPALHRDTEHRGKNAGEPPPPPSPATDRKLRMRVLKKRLQEAVSTENYEHAAVLRDRIKCLEDDADAEG